MGLKNLFKKKPASVTDFLESDEFRNVVFKEFKEQIETYLDLNFGDRILDSTKKELFENVLDFDNYLIDVKNSLEDGINDSINYLEQDVEDFLTFNETEEDLDNWKTDNAEAVWNSCEECPDADESSNDTHTLPPSDAEPKEKEEKIIEVDWNDAEKAW